MRLLGLFILWTTCVAVAAVDLAEVVARGLRSDCQKSGCHRGYWCQACQTLGRNGKVKLNYVCLPENAMC